MSKNLNQLVDTLDSLDSTQDIVNKIISYKEQLDKISCDQLNDNEKIWLLAHEASEKRMPQSLEGNNPNFIEDMILLFKFIPNIND